MKKEKTIQESSRWPRWKYPLKWYTVIVPLFLAPIAFIFPDLELKRRYIIAALLIFSPIIIQTFLWLHKIILTIYKRTINYPNLYDIYKEISSNFDELKNLFFNEMINSRTKVSEIIGAKYQRSELYIILKNNSELNLIEGNKVVVIDKKDSVYLGKFEITEVRDNEYFAVGVNNIDLVWLGYVRQEGETTMMPNIIAISLHSGEWDEK